jgi:hypothetical protein
MMAQSLLKLYSFRYLGEISIVYILNRFGDYDIKLFFLNIFFGFIISLASSIVGRKKNKFYIIMFFDYPVFQFYMDFFLS